MDIAIKRKKGPNLKTAVGVLITLALVLFGARYLWIISQADFTVEADSLTFAEVKKGDFTVSIRGTGILVPDRVEWLSSAVEAKVELLRVKAGNKVQAGEVIVELSNPRLIQQLAEAQWEFEAQEAEFKAAQVSDEVALLTKNTSVVESKMNYESSNLRMNAERHLIKTGAVSKLDYDQSVLETDQQKQRWTVGMQELEKMKENIEAQNTARAARLNKTRKTLERLQEDVDALTVRASMNSVVLDMPLEVGQRVSLGTNIAKLAQKDSLIAELQVPEIQIREVQEGQRVVIDTRNNKVEGVVIRVAPSVTNGSVQVDVSFVDGLPKDARPDLSVDGEIMLAGIDSAIYVDRPLFSQSQSKAALYRVTDDGQFAERVKVSLGLGSINQIQVLDGLNPGDTIVTSDPSGFSAYNKFRIN
ncbi:Multidrug resistance efflux pump [Alteromonadaceae bacterium Bs31]|nr:Multidrug resistance efflux pump [Alteromonadaceae bacterium Bs31]